MADTFSSKAALNIDKTPYTMFRLDAVYKKFPQAQRLPFSLKILLENLLRTEDELNVRVDVTWLAKWKTTLQLVAIGFLLAGDAGDTILPVFTPIGLSLLWLSALLTLYTGYDYFRAGVRHLIE